MHDLAGASGVLATLSKHRIAGIVAIVLGAALLIFGGVRTLSRVATAPLVPLIGIAIVVLGILVFARVL